ncbi:SseB family protein [Microbacterium oxydans]|nr:SseB family protein [Microbacterium oxydans]
MKDNVLLREALTEIEAGATNDQLLGVMRQALQGHLYIRVNGDARAQISEGKALSVAVVRDSEDRQYMLAFSSAGAVRDSVQLEADPSSTSAVAQPVTSVLQQVVSGDFAGLIVDNASAPHRVVFPTELLQKTLEQADVDMTVKSILAAPSRAGLGRQGRGRHSRPRGCGSPSTTVPAAAPSASPKPRRRTDADSCSSSRTRSRSSPSAAATDRSRSHPSSSRRCSPVTPTSPG